MRSSVNVGDRFGRLTVIELAGVATNCSGESTRLWRCRCDCGGEKVIREPNFKYGHTRSCGCLYKETRATAERFSTHGKSHDKLYAIWGGMISRCENKTDREKFANYGGRGISVCTEWRNCYEAFEKWALENGYKKGLSIDRIDVNGDYSPSNCRWANSKMQANNRRNNIRITIDNQTKTLTEWCNELNLPYSRMWHRITQQKMDPVKAFTQP